MNELFINLKLRHVDGIFYFFLEKVYKLIFFNFEFGFYTFSKRLVVFDLKHKLLLNNLMISFQKVCKVFDIFYR